MVYLNGGIILHLIHGNIRFYEIMKDILTSCVIELALELIRLPNSYEIRHDSCHAMMNAKWK